MTSAQDAFALSVFKYATSSLLSWKKFSTRTAGQYECRRM